jgi:hypothetical protein
MSKETIHHRCGHTSTANLFGRCKDRERKATWLGERTDCPDCTKAAFDVANAASATENSAKGLPTLKGTEKQIAWAETLRNSRFESIEQLVKLVELWHDEPAEPLTNLCQKANVAQDVQLAAENLADPTHAETIIAAICSQEDASWWIDHRDFKLWQLVSSVCGVIAANERSAVAKEANNEATLRPASETVTNTVADIRYVGNSVNVRFAEIRDDFRAVVKSLGYRWNGTCWALSLGATTGETSDRLAETAHRLVGAGFAVRMHDAPAQAKALSGDFEPDTRRWVSLRTQGKYAGWLDLQWSTTDDLYKVARSLPGARYAKPAVVVPVSAAEAITEFAERYNMRLTLGAKQAIDKHFSAAATGAIITNIKDRPIPVMAEHNSEPRHLAVPTNVDIDDSLKD